MNVNANITPTKIQKAVNTPFHSRTSAVCKTNEWIRWGAYTTVDCYNTVESEYFATRNQTSLFDMSPMIKYHVYGNQAVDFLNRLVTRDVRKLKIGAVAYVVFCNDRGYVLDDGTLFRVSENDFRLCVQDRHLPWLLDTAFGFKVEIDDVTEDIAALAVQGPTSCAVLKRFGLSDVENLRPFQFTDYEYHGGSLTVSRTGFTGDLGYELWVDPECAEILWDELMALQVFYQIVPLGSRALNLLRIEAGFILPHADFIPAQLCLRPNRGRSPFELGLGWLVDFRKGHFNGHHALVEERKNGSRFETVPLDVCGNKPARDALLYYARKTEIGHVTSAMWSPTCKRNIAIATIQAGRQGMWNDLWADIYVQKELKWQRTMERCRIVEEPFFNPPRRYVTPPKDF